MLLGTCLQENSLPHLSNFASLICGHNTFHVKVCFVTNQDNGNTEKTKEIRKLLNTIDWINKWWVFILPKAYKLRLLSFTAVKCMCGKLNFPNLITTPHNSRHFAHHVEDLFIYDLHHFKWFLGSDRVDEDVTMDIHWVLCRENTVLILASCVYQLQAILLPSHL